MTGTNLEQEAKQTSTFGLVVGTVLFFGLATWMFHGAATNFMKLDDGNVALHLVAGGIAMFIGVSFLLVGVVIIKHTRRRLRFRRELKSMFQKGEDAEQSP